MLILLSLWPVRTCAQSTIGTVPYCCNFEDYLERGQWNFVNDGLNAWHIGTAVQSGGIYSMYISANQGLDNYCDVNPAVSYAYCHIHIPAGLYEISFDWSFLPSSLSIPASATYFRTFLVPDTTTFTAGVLLQGLTNRTLPEGAISIDENVGLSARSYWSRFTNPRVQVPVTDNYYLVFCFVRPYQSDLTSYPTAIDSICITPVQCYKPMALSRRMLQGGCVQLSWKDYNIPRNTMWIVEYGPIGFSRGHGNTLNSYTDSITICGLVNDHIYDFYVSGTCVDNDTTPYSDVLRMRYRDQQNQCLEFDDIWSPNVICTYGNYEFFKYYDNFYPGPYADTGIINFGPSYYGDISLCPNNSRLTIHTDPNETDYYTGGQLHTVPPNECSSVRLGTVFGKWICQSISYNILVDTSAADILVVQYACVLLNPSSHNVLRKPRFILEILDINGLVTDTVCLNYDFSGDNIASNDAWQYGITTRVYWKDWTRAGINLANLHGQPITVRLTTFACGQGADNHYGYAYFNIKCYKSDIKGEVCGNDPSPSTALFKAPAGFSYRWYSPSNPNFSSTDQAIRVPIDNSVYRCDIFLGDTMCKFTKTVVASRNNVEQRFTHANFRYTIDSLSCDHRLTVVNTSYSSNQNNGNIAHDCDFFLWDFGDSTTSSDENPLSHIYNDIGPYVVSLIVGRTDLGCYDTIVDTISFFPGVYNLIRVNICKDSAIAYRFGDQLLTQSGIYTMVLTSETDCDTTIELHLRIRMPPEIQIIGNNIYCEDGTGTLLLRTNGNDIQWSSNPFDSTLIGHEHDTLIVVPRRTPTLYTVIVDTFPRTSDCNSSASIWVDSPSNINALFKMTPHVISDKILRLLDRPYFRKEMVISRNPRQIRRQRGAQHPFCLLHTTSLKRLVASKTFCIQRKQLRRLHASYIPNTQRRCMGAQRVHPRRQRKQSAESGTLQHKHLRIKHLQQSRTSRVPILRPRRMLGRDSQRTSLSCSGLRLSHKLHYQVATRKCLRKERQRADCEVIEVKSLRSQGVSLLRVGNKNNYKP